MSDNELIAVFMGYRLCGQQFANADNRYERDGYEGFIYAGMFEYDESWDKLMPVVEKIESLMPHIKIPDDLLALRTGTHGSEPHYDAVIKFIKWYNANQPKP